MIDRLTFSQIIVSNFVGKKQNYDEVVQFLVAVATAEDSQAWYNPFDTEYQLDYVINYNSVGVKNYLSVFDGYKAFTSTLALPYYEKLVSMMKDGSYSALELALEFSTTPYGFVGDKLPAEIIQDFNKGTLSYVSERRKVIGLPPTDYLGINANCEFLPAFSGII